MLAVNQSVFLWTNKFDVAWPMCHTDICAKRAMFTLPVKSLSLHPEVEGSGGGFTNDKAAERPTAVQL